MLLQKQYRIEFYQLNNNTFYGFFDHKRFHNNQMGLYKKLMNGNL